MIPMLVCARKYGGSGHIGPAHKWYNVAYDVVLCPSCGEDHAIAPTLGNLSGLGLTAAEKADLRERLEVAP